MEADIVGIELSARIVEAFAVGRTEREATLLAEVAQVVRDEIIAVRAHGYEQSARLVDAFAVGRTEEEVALLTRVAKLIRDQAPLRNWL